MPKYAPSDGGFPKLSTYLGGTAISPNGTATVLTPPTGATSAWFHPAGAACYFATNAATADASAPGYVPDGGAGYEGPIDNFGSVAMFQASGTVHVRYYQD